MRSPDARDASPPRASMHALGAAAIAVLACWPSAPSAAQARDTTIAPDASGTPDASASVGAAAGSPTTETPAYRALIDEAVVEYQAQRFLEARALFARAHALYPNARTQRGIGVCAFELREYVQAHHALRAALSTTERPLTAAQRGEVTELLARTARFVGFVHVALPAGVRADVTIDGSTVDPDADGAFVLAIGRHSVRVLAEGHEPLDRSVEILGGESPTLTPTPITVASTTTTPQTTPPVVEDARSSDPTLAYVLLASGGAAGLAAIGVGAFGWPGRDAELSRCEAAGIACDNAAPLRAERDATIGLTVGLGVAASALIVVGAVLLVEGSSGATTVACTGGPLGGSCRVRF